MLPYRFGLGLRAWLGKCVLCQINPITFGYLCEACDTEQHWLPTPFVVPVNDKSLTIQPASFYEGVMGRAIAKFKDEENVLTLPFLVHSLSKLAECVQDLPDETLIVPIPTTGGRLAERGFYPVWTLVRYFSALTGFGIYTGVVRPLESRHQRGLDRAERLMNLKGAFVLENLPDSEQLLLFDDVSTTGATLSELAEVLWRACPTASIAAVCLAHGSARFDEGDLYKNSP